ncbi:glutamine synthetase [Erysipelothrix larvae]|uniref:Glutamine synthetase n=1 Tax=Erysipelothrix larvae TaxID=1514105 RepID=A0A0X8GYH5_9FIRM|nr:glutamine synthetase III [Erysipelothrix larvae]AMC92757.1 glutamine synthetase [Erysipelothrix larvae]
MTDKPYECFGLKCFDEETMIKYLPRPVYTKWKQSIHKEEPMDRETADAIAHAMKTWALENGATHYSHWFIPMTGSSAEKHDAFLEPDSKGDPIFRFSGKNLIKGETDGSSFPNGGLRQTFEARGYTYWDVSSPVFLRGHVLFIPSVFISFHGDSLDEKAPLLKSMDAMSQASKRVLHALGDTDVQSVRQMVGLEQEYFLIKKEDYFSRDDLLFTGRTLFGARPPKDQELVGHYYGSIPSHVVHYMEDVNEELWKLGIYSKVEHNEVAPCQFEIAVVYSDANVAVDRNMLVMETLKRVALKHDMVALLHEKPFSYVNGSGKHNNFSLVTDTGINLFDPGAVPHENIRFLVFVCALLRAVERHSALLRFAASTSGNDQRLGASEAPPAIISMFMGSELEEILNQLEHSDVISKASDKVYYSPLGSLKELPKDSSDRNRTSPFAFTGSKFEFRMPGSSICGAFVNTTLNAIMAESLEQFADELEQNPDNPLLVCQSIIKRHKHIIFNGDGYHDSWVEEARRRNLPNLNRYIDSTAALLYPKTLDLFCTLKILSSRELEARSEISYERHIETLNTEVRTFVSMIRRGLLPAVVDEITRTSQTQVNTSSKYLQGHVNKCVQLADDLSDALDACEKTLAQCLGIDSCKDRAITMDKNLRPHLIHLRDLCDEVELLLPEKSYPYPTYTEILFKV